MRTLIVGILIGISLSGVGVWAGEFYDRQQSEHNAAMQGMQQRQLQNEQREQQSVDRMLRHSGPC